jgi:putative transposase
MDRRLRSAAHCIYRLQLHLVLVTKYRRRCIRAPMLERMRVIFERLLKS